jgi:adenine-specific DNA-methyltransferase
MVDFIKEYLPSDIISFTDLFGGGFNVGINVDCNDVVYNDINPFVTGLIKSFIDIDTYSYLKYVYKLIKDYDLQPSNSDGYIKLRKKYNDTPIHKRDPRMLYTLILFGFQQQIRFNSNYDFNIPCGQRKFNDKLISKFISFARVAKHKRVTINNCDFRLLLASPNNNSFFYLDPPYRETIASYNDGKRGFEGWTIEHEKEMCKLLDSLNECGKKFLLSYIIDVGDFHNDNIECWANNGGYNIVPVEKTQGRYNKRKEIIIKNY